MKSTAILCAIGAATLGFASASFAQGDGPWRYGPRYEQGFGQRPDARFGDRQRWQEADRVDGAWRHEIRERRFVRQAWPERFDRHDHRGWRHDPGWRAGRAERTFVQYEEVQPAYAAVAPAVIVQMAPQVAWTGVETEAMPVIAQRTALAVVKLKHRPVPHRYVHAQASICTPAGSHIAHAPARPHLAQAATRRLG